MVSGFDLIIKSEFKQSSSAQKLKFSIKDFFSKCDQIRSFLRIWSQLQFCAVQLENFDKYLGAWSNE